MSPRAKRSTAAERAAYDVEAEWTPADRELLADIERRAEALPADAPRALLSVRLSVFTDDTTSPVRQELDLRQLAVDRGYRVAGLASDLNVSATKVPPWKRKALGDWLNNRSPEFDVLMFWKLDRFIRNLTDLSVMMNWALKYEKNLVSKHDQIDLTSVAGRIMVTIVGGVAEIEAANTRTRVESLWNYTKTQSEWLVGRPSFGYMTVRDEHDRVQLVHDPEAVALLRRARELIVDGVPATRAVALLKDEGLAPATLTASTLLTRLRNPALMGHRVELTKGGKGGHRRSRSVIGHDGQPVMVGEPIFPPAEFDALQAVLDSRGKDQPQRQASGATKFRGVLICSECHTNMTVHHTRNKHGEYAYLRCQSCKSGGLGAPHPQAVYDRLVEDVLGVLGRFQVQHREYARGEDMRQEIQRLQEGIAYYVEGLAPGGVLSRTKFTQDQGNRALEQLVAELEAIDPDTAEDRWIYTEQGTTFREHWEQGGMDAMAADLLRAGIRCEVTRKKVPGVRAPAVELRLLVPKDVRERLIVREDDFAGPL